jgi:hypothetical protein
MNQLPDKAVAEALSEWLKSPDMMHDKLLFLQDKPIEAEMDYERINEFVCINNEERDIMDLAKKDAIQAIEKYNKARNRYIAAIIGNKLKEKGDTKGSGAIITDDMIEQARRYPIGQLVEVNKHGAALCINHNERHASMDCRNGRCYCYSCGWKGDVIDLYMKINSATFQTAVYALQ